jgi:CO/xanthine dehydrogenase Mo-binding subunit
MERSAGSEPYLRRDIFEKITGRAKYAGDTRLPGMVYAKILRPPSYGAGLKRGEPAIVGMGGVLGRI